MSLHYREGVGKMKHIAPSSARASIQRCGLLTDQRGGFSVDSDWAHQHYGCNPVFLSHQGQASSAEDLWVVDVSGLSLTVDLPSLIDCGAILEEDGFYFSHGHEDLHRAYGELILFSAAIADPAPFISLTQSAACLQSIPSHRLTLALI